MDTMQAEALRRAQEMHRSRESSQPNRTHHNPQSFENRSPGQQNITPAHSETQDETELCTSQQSSPSPVLFEDKEKVLILVLIMILCSEDSSDPTLILALLYLII